MDYKLLYNSHPVPGFISSLLETHKTLGYHPRRLSSFEEVLFPKTSFRDVCKTTTVQNERMPQRYARQVPEFVSDLCFSPDGMFLVATCGDNLHMIDPNLGRVVNNVLNAHENTGLSNLIFYSERKFCCSTVNGCVGFWDARKMSHPLNSFRVHSNAVSKMLYDKDLEWLITSDKDGRILYWYLPAFECSGVNPQDEHYGSLINCPMLNQMCIVNGHFGRKLILSAANSGCLYVIDNLNFEQLARNNDLKRVSLGENIRHFLGLNPRLGSVGVLNQLCFIDQEDYIPVYGANVSLISSMEGIQNYPSMLLRLTTKSSLLTGTKTSDWTICIKIKDRARRDCNLLNFFGADVLDECLLYKSEEPRFCTLKEKKNCISSCGRLIASPQKSGIRLMSFSNKFHNIEEATEWTKKRGVPSMFWPTGPKSFNEVVDMKPDIHSARSFPLCCKFSPICTLLSVGDSTGRVSFYQPKL